MTKADLVSDISDKTGVERIAVQAAVEAFMDSIKSALEKGENVLKRFWKFCCRGKNENGVTFQKILP